MSWCKGLSQQLSMEMAGSAVAENPADLNRFHRCYGDYEEASQANYEAMFEAMVM